MILACSSEIIIFFIFSELLVELVGLFPFESLLDADPARNIKQRKQNASSDELRKEWEWGWLKTKRTRGVWPAQHAESGEANYEREAGAHPEGVVHSYMITDNNVNCEIYCLMIEHRHIISNENIVNFIAGLLGGFMSVTICNPLDIARSRLNVLVSFVSTCRRLLATKTTRASTPISHMRCVPFGRRRASRASMQVPSPSSRLPH